MKRVLIPLFAFCDLSISGAYAQVRQTLPADVQASDRANTPVYRGWTVFVHPLFGYELPVPPGVGAVTEYETSGETRFTSLDGSFVMSAWGGLSPQSPSKFMESLWRQAKNRPGRTVTYQRKGGSWFVVSGTDSAGVEFYEKFSMRGNQVAAFTLTYPRSRLLEFEPWVERIEDGFRVAAANRRTREGGPPSPAGSDRIGPGTRGGSEPSGSLSARSDYRPEAGPRTSSKPKADPPSSQKTPERDPAKSEAIPKRNSDPPEKQPPVEENSSSIPENLPFGEKVPGRAGFVYSPFKSDKSIIDVAGIPSGTKVECPYTKKIFRVP